MGRRAKTPHDCYMGQLRSTKGRFDKVGKPIKFRLTFDQWFHIWLESGHWEERGNRAGKYVMSRNNDLGHYEVGNVQIKLQRENMLESLNTVSVEVARSVYYAQGTYTELEERFKIARSTLWKIKHLRKPYEHLLTAGQVL